LAAQAFSQEHVALAVAEVFQAILLVLLAHVLNRQFFKPVHRVDDQRPKAAGIFSQSAEHFFSLLECSWLDAGHVEVVRALLVVKKQRVGQFAGERRFAEAFRRVDDQALRAADGAAFDGQLHCDDVGLVVKI
jgi:hypothetical protein